ncbi:MAG: hypothetical protein ACI8SE_000768 [Bacteroidia bacterium]|jgi:hypothetical protein
MKNSILVLFCLSFVGVFAQTDEVQINEQDKTQSIFYPNEPSICISRSNPNAIVAGANIANHYWSSNNGASWKNGILKSTYGVWGDPVLHSDADGNIYFVHLSRTSGKNKGYGFIDRIVIQTSTDDGETFSNGAFTGLNEPKMQDKPWISTDDFSSQFKGNAYLTWTEFDKMNSKKKRDQSRIRFSASSDIGQTWSEAITISDSVGDAVDDDHTLEGATTAVGVNGEIYCVWAGHHKLYFDKSVDGGKTWGTDKVIFNQQSGWAMDIPHVFRSNGMPFLVVDNSASKYTGRLYLVWGDNQTGDADVFFSYSDDEGANWSAQKRVHSDPKGNGKSQYLPNMAIDQTTGQIAIAYYDRRWSENNTFTDIFVSVSTDGGAQFDDYRFNNIITGHIGKEMFSGDYIDIDFHDGKIAAIWSGFDKYTKVYNRTLMTHELNQLFPIYNIGQLKTYVSTEEKKPVFYVVATRPTNVQITYYKKPLFSKKLKIKTTDSLEINHRPGLQGSTEIKINALRKRRIQITFTPTETEMYPNGTIEINYRME